MERRLCEAAMEGSVISLINLLQEDPLALDRFIVGCYTETPLHIASMLGHVQFVNEILNRKPELAAELDTRKSSPLHLAAAKGYLDIVKKLVVVNPDMCLVGDRDGRTPLHVAAIKGNVSILRDIVGARPHAARVLMERGQTILHACVRYNQLEAMKFLLETMGDPEFVNYKDGDSNTILHLAVADKQTETINFLIASTTIEVNALNANGFTAFDILVQGKGELKDIEIAELALKRGGATHAKESFIVPVHDELEGIRSLSSPTKGTAKSRRGKARKNLSGNKQDWLERKRNALIVVASLIATMGFQAGVNPPGGVCQDTSHDTTMPHKAGFSIMADNDPNRYRNFLAYNSLSFLASLSIILLLISGLPLKRRFFVWILMVIMWVAITSMAITYGISILAFTPSHEEHVIYRVLFSGILVWNCLMALLLLAHTIRLIVKLVTGLNRLRRE